MPKLSYNLLKINDLFLKNIWKLLFFDFIFAIEIMTENNQTKHLNKNIMRVQFQHKTQFRNDLVIARQDFRSLPSVDYNCTIKGVSISRHI